VGGGGGGGGGGGKRLVRKPKLGSGMSMYKQI